MNASGIRDTARVLHVSTNTVMDRNKKKESDTPARESAPVTGPASRASGSGDLPPDELEVMAWADLRTRRNVELCAQQSASAMALARH